MNLKSLAALTLAASVPLASAGPLAYGLCQTASPRRPGCNALVVSCYAGAGFTFGVTVVGAPAAIIACNAGLGTCMAACAATALIAPIP
ncbi:hypothetical protein J3R82DRAFT_3138 [Butyriboletus roseoflavus]|nr:hypothetical protein J3R82DRAFT_3138 [Butyriboletus roseoflavus]